MILKKVKQWCDRNGWSKPFLSEGKYYAFAPNTVIPELIPIQGKTPSQIRMTRLQQIGLPFSLVSLVCSLAYLSIDEIIVLLGRILSISFLIGIITVVYTYMQRSFFKAPLSTGVKISLMLSLALSTLTIAISRSEVIVRLLHQLQHIFAYNALLIPAIPALPMPLAVLAIATGFIGLILAVIVFYTTLIFGD